MDADHPARGVNIPRRNTLRALEIEAIRELRAYTSHEDQKELDAAELSIVNVDQFYGIEIGEFPARIAETALWMMDHIMNSRLSLEFGQTYVRIPLRKSPHILHGDALETDWEAFLPSTKCSFVFGNPPFIGAKYQSDEQRAQVRHIAGLGKTGGTLDYVTAWFIKAGQYVVGGKASIGFVSTNSITQGEQVAQLWPLLFDRFKLEIAFAHRTFAWGSDARGKAHVHVVILGLTKATTAPKIKRLFSYDDINGEPHESQHTAISPYLFDAGKLANPHVVVKEESKSLNGLPKLIIGSKPIDGGYLILPRSERDNIIRDFPEATDWIRPYVGSKEYLNGGDRWILAVQSISPTKIKDVPPVSNRLRNVRRYRLGEIPARNKEASTKKAPGISSTQLASTPAEYHVTVLPKAAFLVLPEVSSERRDYAPIGWLEPPTVPSNKLRVLLDAPLHLFGVLTSNMHMAWMRAITGRMKSDYMYSIGVVYNAFPMPPSSDVELKKLEPLAQAVLDARAAHAGATLADLYDPDLMPANLRKAHQALDRAVDKLYRKSGFSSESERVEHLLGLYEKMVAPLTAAEKMKKAKKRKASYEAG